LVPQIIVKYSAKNTATKILEGLCQLKNLSSFRVQSSEFNAAACRERPVWPDKKPQFQIRVHFENIETEKP
jgi:hypothetical protein